MSTHRLDPPLESGVDYGGQSEFPSLRNQPELYPGTPPQHDYVYRRGHIWKLRLKQGNRLSKARVVWIAPDARRFSSLTNVLLRWGATEITQRIPVLAVGSNIYPRQLFDKFQDALIDDTIPAVRGVIQNLEIAFCPFLNPFGYVPVTPRYRAGARTHAWLQLLSLGQLQLIASSEKSYQFVLVPNSVAPFTVVDSQETIPLCYMFWHRRWMAMYGELPPVCAGTVEEGDQDLHITSRTRSEEEILTSILPRMIEPNSLEKAPSSTRFNRVVQDSLLNKAIERDPPSGVLAVEVNEECARYGDLISEFSDSRYEGVAVVRCTGPTRNREGDREILACVPQAYKEELGIGGYAAVYNPLSTHVTDDLTDSRLLGIPVRVVGESRPLASPRPTEIKLDQMARVAIGVSPGEHCNLAPLKVPISIRFGNTIGRLFAARWLGGRGVKATGPVLERPMCWIDRSMLTALGVDEGGSVVVAAIEAMKGKGSPRFVLRYRKLQAHAPPPEQVAARMTSLHPDDPDARFPDPSEILGVFPDLPWVWIDQQTRSVLGLGAKDTISPVIVRPSVGYLFARMTSRFVLATLGIGAGLAVAANRVVADLWPDSHFGRLVLSDLVAVIILGIFMLGALLVIFINARR
jgi:hypothetical protein